ncbi:hypothetical protein ACHAPD_010798 [Fusarium lateritium]
MSLFLEADLETGLRQLQLVAHKYPLNIPEMIEKSRSYSLNTPHGYNFKTDYLDAFLRWVSKPWSPSVALLKSESNMEGMLIWEIGEQFELLWMFAFHNSDSTSTAKTIVKFPLFNIGAEFARVFWWRFHRSVVKVFEMLGENVPTDDQVEQKWNDCLDWLSQGKLQSRVADFPMSELEFKLRPKYNDANPYSQWLPDFFSKLNYHGSFISTRLPEAMEEPEHIVSDSRLPATDFAEEQLSEIVYSEIQRRRLPEELFAFLFNDTRVNQEPSNLSYTMFEAMVAGKQSFVLSTNIVNEWRQEEEKWKAVEAYVSKSEWHMTSLKLKLVGGVAASEEERDGWGIYKEIVIV